MSSTKLLIHVHSQNLETELSDLFKMLLKKKEFQWVLLKIQNCNTAVSFQEQLIDIREDGNLLAEFQQKPLHKWWMGLKNK